MNWAGEPMIFPAMMDDRMLSQTVRWEIIQFSQNIYVMLIELILGLCGICCLRYYTPSAFIWKEAFLSCIFYLSVVLVQMAASRRHGCSLFVGHLWVDILYFLECVMNSRYKRRSQLIKLLS